MEKLIKLLNESTNGRFKSEQDLRLCIEMRGYCREFISWLVDNDKIDFEKKLNTIRFESLVDQTLDSYLALLMLLSIQDNPIEFLVSILK